MVLVARWSRVVIAAAEQSAKKASDEHCGRCRTRRSSDGEQSESIHRRDHAPLSPQQFAGWCPEQRSEGKSKDVERDVQHCKLGADVEMGRNRITCGRDDGGCRRGGKGEHAQLKCDP